MNILLSILACAGVLIGFLGSVVPMLPGTPLMLFSFIALAWLDGFVRVGWGTLLALGTLTVLSLVLDFAAGMLGAKRFGASRAGLAGALIGTVLGAFFGLLGLLFLPFIGALAAELLINRPFKEAANAGLGAWLGYLAGSALRVASASAMLAIFAWSWFL